MEKKRGADRFAVSMCPELLSYFAQESGPWYESPDEVEAGLVWGEEKRHMLAWIQGQMDEHLSARQREYLTLYYFEGLTYREISERTGTNPTSALRGVKRSLLKLRSIAQSSPPRCFTVRPEEAGGE